MPNSRGGSYYDVITEAVNDLAEHGFDSVERVAFWEARIREAADASMIGSARMEEMLRNVLRATYARMTAGAKLAQRHVGVGKFTLERIAAAARLELDRRILASANLIKINRKKRIEETLSRFSGWATSIPRGGAAEADKAEEKARIRKPLATLKFEERRVLIDQGHKLTSSINDVVATDGGAIAAKWRSNWRQPGYDYRPDHKDRDEHLYGIRGSWAFARGLLKKPPDGWTDEITKPAEEPFCRCFYTYYYNLRDVPKDWLTRKGEEHLAAARAKAAA